MINPISTVHYNRIAITAVAGSVTLTVAAASLGAVAYFFMRHHKSWGYLGAGAGAGALFGTISVIGSGIWLHRSQEQRFPALKVYKRVDEKSYKSLERLLAKPAVDSHHLCRLKYPGDHNRIVGALRKLNAQDIFQNQSVEFPNGAVIDLALPENFSAPKTSLKPVSELDDADFKALLKLEKKCFTEISDTYEELRDWMGKKGGDVIQIHTEKNTLAGFIYYRPGQSDKKEGDWHISTVACAPEYTGLGLGKELMQVLTQLADGENKTMTLQCRASNVAAQNLYLHSGFDFEDNVTPCYPYPAENGLFMRRLPNVASTS